MKKLLILITLTVLLTATVMYAYSGFYGTVKKLGSPVQNAKVIFKELGTTDSTINYTNANGYYQAEVGEGSYWAKASDGPSWIHVKDSVYQTGHVGGTECNFNLINIAK